MKNYYLEPAEADGTFCYAVIVDTLNGPNDYESQIIGTKESLHTSRKEAIEELIHQFCNDLEKQYNVHIGIDEVYGGLYVEEK